MGEKKKAAVKPAEAPKVTSLRLDANLHERARILGVKSRTTLQAIVNEALGEYLKKRGA